MPFKGQRLRVDGVVQPETSDVNIVGGSTKVRTGKSLTATPIGGGAQEDAVMWARVGNPTNPGDNILNLDRNGGLLDTLSESRILIGSGSIQHDYKAVTPTDVTGSTITLPSAMTYGHSPGDLVAILAPSEGVRASMLGLANTPTNNVAAFNRFAQHNGLAHLAGGAGVIFDIAVFVNDMLKCRGDMCFLHGYGGIINGEGGIFQSSSMTFPSNLSKSLLAFQDKNGVTPTFANPSGQPNNISMENMILWGTDVGGSGPSQGSSDSIAVVGIADGGYINSIRYRYFDGPGGICIGGHGIELNNLQHDWCRYGACMWGDGWTLMNMNVTNGQYLLGQPNHAVLRVIGGEGGAALGGDYETAPLPGCVVSIEGDATGVLLDTIWTSGLSGGNGWQGVLINVDSVGQDSLVGCEYTINNFHNEQIANDPAISPRTLRDVQRQFSIASSYLQNYGRSLTARTVSKTQVIYGWGGVASANSPQPAGTL